MEIDVIGGQYQNVILRIPWLACHNPKIDWRTGEVKMIRCLEEYERQWRLKQGKSGWQKQKEEEKREEAGRKWKERKERQREKKKNQKKEKRMEVRKVVEKWKIWDEKKEAAKSEEEAKRLVPAKFYK